MLKNCNDCLHSNSDAPPDFCDRADEEAVEKFWEEADLVVKAGGEVDCIFCPGFEEESQPAIANPAIGQRKIVFHNGWGIREFPSHVELIDPDGNLARRVKGCSLGAAVEIFTLGWQVGHIETANNLRRK